VEGFEIVKVVATTMSVHLGREPVEISFWSQEKRTWRRTTWRRDRIY
jgi:hypothetical protein